MINALTLDCELENVDTKYGKIIESYFLEKLFKNIISTRSFCSKYYYFNNAV